MGEKLSVWSKKIEAFYLDVISKRRSGYGTGLLRGMLLVAFKMRRFFCNGRLFLCVVPIVVLGLAAFRHLAVDRGLPVTNGIRNFGRIDEHLYRGAQPDADGIAKLKQLGVAMIINLRMSNEVWTTEAAEAMSNSILFTNLPLEGMGRPTAQDIARVLAVIESAPGPVFVHCAHGCDRTGTIVACYRIKHDGWDAEAALKEADRYGMSWFERGMRAYVSDFAHEAGANSAAAKK